MASTLTTRGADIALRALRLGAADYVPKPSAVHGDETFRRELMEKVKGLARLRRRVAAAGARDRRAASATGRDRAAAAAGDRQFHRRSAGAVHAGPGAGPTLNVPVVLTQHMPATFTPILAEHITSSAACRAPRRRTANCWPPAASIWRPATAPDWSMAAAPVCRRGSRRTRRRISAAPRSIRCCAAPPRPARGACWSRC